MMGRALQAKGENVEASNAFRLAAQHLEVTLGPDHPDTWSARRSAALEIPSSKSFK